MTEGFRTPCRSAAALLVVLGALLSPALGRAQTTGDLKIAIIDVQAVLSTSQIGKQADAEMRKLQDQKRDDLQAKQKEIQDLQKKIADGRLSLSEDALKNLQDQLEEKTTAARRFQDDARRELQKKQDELLKGLEGKIMPVINALGKEQGYTMIFRKFESGLVYADDALDITSSVIQRLDAQGSSSSAGSGSKPSP